MLLWANDFRATVFWVAVVPVPLSVLVLRNWACGS